MARLGRPLARLPARCADRMRSWPARTCGAATTRPMVPARARDLEGSTEPEEYSDEAPGLARPPGSSAAFGRGLRKDPHPSDLMPPPWQAVGELATRAVPTSSGRFVVSEIQACVVDLRGAVDLGGQPSPDLRQRCTWSSTRRAGEVNEDHAGVGRGRVLLRGPVPVDRSRERRATARPNPDQKLPERPRMPSTVPEHLPPHPWDAPAPKGGSVAVAGSLGSRR